MNAAALMIMQRLQAICERKCHIHHIHSACAKPILYAQCIQYNTRCLHLHHLLYSFMSKHSTDTVSGTYQQPHNNLIFIAVSTDLHWSLCHWLDNISGWFYTIHHSGVSL